jgi:hypothetical protein
LCRAIPSERLTNNPRNESGVAKDDVMHRFIHPLSFFAAFLLLVGLILNGAINGLICREGCASPGTADLRTHLALALLGPGLLFAIAAWNIALGAHFRRSWRAGAALFCLPVIVWVILLTAAPALGIPGLGAGRSNGLITAITVGALTLFTVASILFVLPAPAENATHPSP